MSAIRSLDILSVKKEPKLSARDTTEEIEGNGDGSATIRSNEPIARSYATEGCSQRPEGKPRQNWEFVSRATNMSYMN